MGGGDEAPAALLDGWVEQLLRSGTQQGPDEPSNGDHLVHEAPMQTSVSSRHCIKGGQTRVLEILRGGGINYQAVRQNIVKIQGGALRIQGGANAPLCPPLNETLQTHPQTADSDLLQPQGVPAAQSPTPTLEPDLTDQASPRDLFDTSEDTLGTPHNNHSPDEMAVSAPDAVPEQISSVDVYQDPPRSSPTTPTTTLDGDICTKSKVISTGQEGRLRQCVKPPDRFM